MKQFQLIILCLFFTCAGTGVFAQVSFSSKVSSNRICKTELLEVNYEVQNGEIENFSQPNFTGWQVVGGPNMSSSTFISNGQKTVSMSYQFILKPLSTGSFTIPGAKAVVNGKSMSSNPVAVVVDNKTHGNATPNPSASLMPFFEPAPMSPPVPDMSEDYDGYLLRSGENAEEKTKKNLFILIDVSKKSCYEGEAIVANYQLYSRVNLNAHITRRPSFSGFSSIDLPDASNSEFEVKEYKGKQFRVYNVRKVQLYPLQAGVQTLEPVEIDATVQYKKVPLPNQMRNYDPYSPDNNVNFPFIIKSEPVQINVLPFPAENKPAGFTSVAGNFTIRSSLRESQLAKNQAGTLRVEIEGAGNWSMMQTPVVNWPAHAEVFEATVTENLDSQQAPVTGKKIYDFPFSVADTGIVTISPITLSFFNPGKKEYETIQTQPLKVQILNTSLPSTAQEIPLENQGDLTSIFTDVVVIAFPIIAVLLLVWVVVKYRHRRRMEVLQKPWRQHNEGFSGFENQAWQESNNDRFMPMVKKGYPEKEVEEATPVMYSYEAVQIITESVENTAANESNIDTRQYFGTIKKEISRLLRSRWNIYETSPAEVKMLLEKKGMIPEDAESISMLLAACEKHIYSPFTETIITSEWDEIFAEIKFILDRKNGQPMA
jgi:hypothetical protein